MYFFCHPAIFFYTKWTNIHNVFVCRCATYVKKIISVVDINPIKGSAQFSFYHVVCNIFILYYKCSYVRNQLLCVELVSHENAQLGAVLNISAI